MKVDRLTVEAELTRDADCEESKQLIALHQSGDSIVGLVDQFQWMPFIVIGCNHWFDSNDKMMITFNLRMVAK